MKKKSYPAPITSTEFDRFLAVLDDQRERAGEIYERLRSSLTVYFIGKKFVNAEDLADEVIDRVIRRVNDDAKIYDIAAYCRKVAWYVAIEEWRTPSQVKETSQFLSALSRGISHHDEVRLDLLQEGLDRLTPESRSLFLEYYQWSYKGHRAELARQRSMSMPALHTQVFRIKQSLRAYINTALDTPVSNEGFYFELRGDSVWGRKVKCGSEVRLKFDYGVACSNVLNKIRGKRLPREDANIGISVSAIGFVLKDQIWFRMVRFLRGALAEPAIFTFIAAAQPVSEPCFYITLDVRGCILYQFKLDVELVDEKPRRAQFYFLNDSLDLDLDAVQYIVGEAERAAGSIHP